MPAAGNGSRLTLEAVVIRADGTREDLGVVATSDPAGPGTIKIEKETDHGEQ